MAFFISTQYLIFFPEILSMNSTFLANRCHTSDFWLVPWWYVDTGCLCSSYIVKASVQTSMGPILGSYCFYARLLELGTLEKLSQVEGYIFEPQPFCSKFDRVDLDLGMVIGWGKVFKSRNQYLGISRWLMVSKQDRKYWQY